MMEQGRLAILGGGESGVGAAILAKKKGLVPFLSDAGSIKDKYKKVLDKFEIEWEEGGHSFDRLSEAKEVVKSPGIPKEISLIQELEALGIQLISEVEFAFRYTAAKLIAVTGSNGKTTTANLIYHMLKKAGLNVGLAGNVGNSFAYSVATEQFDYYVLELSSFQLDDVRQFKAFISILLNITPDHLDRYENDFHRYAHAKCRIAMNSDQSDFLIYNADDQAIENALKKTATKATLIPFSIKQKLLEGAYLDKNKLTINLNNNHFNMSVHDLALQGKHNLYNSMASGIAGRILDLRKEIIRESLSDFQNVEHRLEKVASVHGIEFINDSKATNVNSTWYALESMAKPTIWILGGVDKGNDYGELLELVKDKVKAIICLGTDNKKIVDAFKDTVELIEEANSAEEAVNKAYEIGQKGDAVLLSPACASFDLFENYEDRGHQFKRAVRAL
jgi:UDP-N-acetylmuramoylalanine--D-glutamate ligase